MLVARQISLIISITIWATMTGGVMYTHLVYFPVYLSHLLESNKLITGDYGLHDGNFWMFIHPLAIIATTATLQLNWKQKTRRKFILTTLVIYVLALVATATYFLPELMAFADSAITPNVTPAEWFKRGQIWQHLSWLRGFFIYTGFIVLLISLTKDKQPDDR